MSRDEHLNNSEQPSIGGHGHPGQHHSNTNEHGTELHGSNMIEPSNT
jgi:hypothetical protein